MHQDLFFNLIPPKIDLAKIHDRISEGKQAHSLFKDSKNELDRGSEFILDWMVKASKELRLIDDDGVWNLIRIKKYLNSKLRFLRLLMLGIFHTNYEANPSNISH
jgi:hypothetical protein